MTRKQTLELYRSIRADIRRHLAAAQKLGTNEDLFACAELLGIVRDGDIVADDSGFDMLADTLVFTPNASKSRIIDRYSAGLADPRERAFVRRISKAMFSVWEVAGKHEMGGLVIDDALGRRKRRRLMDEALTASARKGVLLGMRLFDAGPFACAFGIIVPVSPLDAMVLRAGSLPPSHLHLLLYASAIHGIDAAEMLLSFGEESQAA